MTLCGAFLYQPPRLRHCNSGTAEFGEHFCISHQLPDTPMFSKSCQKPKKAEDLTAALTHSQLFTFSLASFIPPWSDRAAARLFAMGEHQEMGTSKFHRVKLPRVC